jgi:Trk K+ transport system NAD-binding subunit
LHRDFIIEQNDRLILEGPVQNLIIAQEDLNIRIQPDSDIDLVDLDTEDCCIFEATLSPRSKILGRTLKEIRFRDRFGLSVLAVA